MSNRYSTLAVAAVVLFALATGARAELVDSISGAQDAVEVTAQSAKPVPTPLVQPQRAVLHRVASAARPCTRRYATLLLGIGF
jgi:hypothetical protein